MLRPRSMKIYDSFGPNPRALRMFLHEKGIEIPKAAVDLLGMENRRPPYTDRNPGGQLPSLEMDDGRVIGNYFTIQDIRPLTPQGSRLRIRFEQNRVLRVRYLDVEVPQ